MEHNFNREVRINTEGNTGLYPWSLGEFDRGTGEQIGSPFIPWRWMLDFRATRLRFSRFIGRDDTRVSSDVGGGNFFDRERISCDLVTETKASLSAWGGKTRLSMMGTDREIKTITLEIKRLAHGEPESCLLSGDVEFEYEVDFYNKVQEDWLAVEVGITPERYDSLLNQLRAHNDVALLLHLSGADGFFANWTPSIFTDEIKVVGEGCFESIEKPEGFEIPKLGKVTSFSLEIDHELCVTEKKSEVKPEDLDNDEARREELSPSLPLPPVAPPLTDKKLFSELKTPLWLISGLLVAILIFK